MKSFAVCYSLLLGRRPSLEGWRPSQVAFVDAMHVNVHLGGTLRQKPVTWKWSSPLLVEENGLLRDHCALQMTQRVADRKPNQSSCAYQCSSCTAKTHLIMRRRVYLNYLYYIDSLPCLYTCHCWGWLDIESFISFIPKHVDPRPKTEHQHVPERLTPRA